MTYGNYPDLNTIKRILVVKMRHHGDVLLTSPLFTELKQAIPQATIDALIYSDTLPMLEGHPAISHYLLCDRGWKQLPLFKKLGKELSLLHSIGKNRYDLVINLTEGDRGAIAALYSGAEYKVGLDTGKKGFFKQKARYTHPVKTPSSPRHTVEKQLDALRRIGIFPKPQDRDLSLHIPQDSLDKVTRLLQEVGLTASECIVIHPVSRWRFKCLSPQQMAEVVKGLHQRQLPLIFSGGPDPVEKAFIEQILALAPHIPALNLAGKLSLKDLCALIRLSKALVTVDSVPLHIASATKTPVVALFGPTSEQNWGPWMHPRSRVVTTPFSCRPCYQDGCGGSKMSDCLFSIPPARILSALEEILV